MQIERLIPYKSAINSVPYASIQPPTYVYNQSGTYLTCAIYLLTQLCFQLPFTYSYIYPFA